MTAGSAGAVQRRKVSWVVEADIRGFFDHVNHEWLMKFLEQRIGDPRILRLIVRLLKGGVMEDGLITASEEGTPQGAILSPLLSNVYLHYTLICGSSGALRRVAGEKRICFGTRTILSRASSIGKKPSASSERTWRSFIWSWKARPGFCICPTGRRTCRSRRNPRVHAWAVRHGKAVLRCNVEHRRRSFVESCAT